MTTVLGITCILFGMLGWIGQIVTAVSPKLAATISLTECESDVDPAFWADIRGEAVWDALVLWTLPAAGLLLLLKNGWWPYFGLIGGAVYVYFAGRGIATRLEMQRRNIQIGKPESVKLFYAFLSLWGLLGLVMVFIAASELRL